MYNPEMTPEAEPPVPAKWQKLQRSQQGLLNLGEQLRVRKGDWEDKSKRG